MLISIAKFSRKEDSAGCRSLELLHSRRILLLHAGFGQTSLATVSYSIYLLLGLSLLFSSFPAVFFVCRRYCSHPAMSPWKLRDNPALRRLH